MFEKSINFIVILLIIGAFVFPAVESVGVTLRSTYGEPCNKTLRCKSQSWLICNHQEEVCECSKPDDMIFDSSRDKCVTLIGERCKYGFDEDAGQNMWYEKADCVKGAVCGPSGVCSCPIGFYEDNENNQCSPVKSFGENCTRGIECNLNKFLSCVEGLCNCDPDNASYNKERFSYYDNRYGTINIPAGVCVGRVSTQCSYTSGKYCVKNANCYQETCQCASSYTETSERLCGLGHAQTCSSENICSDTLRCAGTVTESGLQEFNRCTCPNPGYQFYDESKKNCVGKVGSPCFPYATICTNKSSCISKDENAGIGANANRVFRCECDEGFVETASRACEIAYGNPCQYTNNRQARNEMFTSHLCDSAANLQCKYGECACENEADIYEESRRQCSKPVGVSCKNNDECVENSFCSITSKKTTWGRCICNKSFVVAKNQTCVPFQNASEDEELRGSTENVEVVTVKNIHGTEKISNENETSSI